ncbi:alpha/beta fold hydrolase [Streptomyces sp. HNM0575]|uniref:alpha/beta hydrolase family protein n=1 Tax=Streptomyces sp. HNM0575 TaxID=2716338 RepID=UPI00145CCF94|nr:alpha/beta fold hydrolase [Streptomyces sp. HNM0575]NLU71404.1 alpha/beta fold hydrolase [Streptomyces sp. HNM0575]
MSTAFTEAAGFPVDQAAPVVSYAPMTVPVPGRAVDLQIKVSVPETGGELPVIVLSHGNGPSNFVSSLYGYGPLAHFWAAHGFVVIQPTHLDSMTLGLREAGSYEAPLYWRTRVEDVRAILDHLDRIESTVPGLSGRIDRGRIAAVGHSMGGHTVGMLCGSTVTDPVDGSQVHLPDERIRAGVLLGAPGVGDDLAPYATEHWPILGTTRFDRMTTPALVVTGDDDTNRFFSERKDWRADAYRLAPGRKSLLWLYGAGHGFGGISTYDAAETTDENPERVAALRALVWAYLRSELYPDDKSWNEASTVLETMDTPWGRAENRP